MVNLRFLEASDPNSKEFLIILTRNSVLRPDFNFQKRDYAFTTQPRKIKRVDL
jgi:hypothetical protein